MNYLVNLLEIVFLALIILILLYSSRVLIFFLLLYFDRQEILSKLKSIFRFLFAFLLLPYKVKLKRMPSNCIKQKYGTSPTRKHNNNAMQTKVCEAFNKTQYLFTNKHRSRDRHTSCILFVIFLSNLRK